MNLILLGLGEGNLKSVAEVKLKATEGLPGAQLHCINTVGQQGALNGQIPRWECSLFIKEKQSA